MATKSRPIKDQVIVVGGATTPVGIAVARRAARRGARLMLVGVDEAVLGETARAINNAGGRADFVVAGPADVKALEVAVLAALTRFGRIDSWVEAGAPPDWRMAARALRGRWGVLIVVAVDPGEVETMRDEVARGMTFGSVLGGPGDDPQRVADAVLRVAERPDRDIVLGDGGGRGFSAYLPSAATAATAAIGLGGLALAAGALALLRRRRRA